MIHELDIRSRQILGHIVDLYVETGEPVGSRTLSRCMGLSISPATVRNIMSDLEDAGLLYAPHTSAGRVPTDAGLRFFVNGLLEVGDLEEPERQILESSGQGPGKNLSGILESTLARLSGLTQCAGIVRAPKCETRLKHIEFVSLAPDRILVILVTEEGIVENRVLEMADRISSAVLAEANACVQRFLVGRTLEEVRAAVQGDLQQSRIQIHERSQKLVEEGIAVWSGTQETGTLIVRGQGHLLHDIQHLDELDRVRELFEMLETRQDLVQLLDEVIAADGVQIFIGSEHKRLCDLSGCSMIMAPFSNGRQKIIGAIGVIGPTRMHYGRIIPMVNYTARLVERLMLTHTPGPSV
jgi:heat-inducible transcriptional repressor